MERTRDASPAGSAGGSPVATADGLALATRMVAAAEAAAAAALRLQRQQSTDRLQRMENHGGNCFLSHLPLIIALVEGRLQHGRSGAGPSSNTFLLWMPSLLRTFRSSGNIQRVQQILWISMTWRSSATRSSTACSVPC